MKMKHIQLGDDGLQKLVEGISLEYFGRSFQHKALFNKRLRTTGGRYLLHSHHIEVNPKQYEYYGEGAIIGIIKHELCHYHLHIQKMGYRHGDAEFKHLMEKVGAPRYCAVIPGVMNQSRTSYMYECVACKLHYVRKRKINVEKYACGQCHGKLKIIT